MHFFLQISVVQNLKVKISDFNKKCEHFLSVLGRRIFKIALAPTKRRHLEKCWAHLSLVD